MAVGDAQTTLWRRRYPQLTEKMVVDLVNGIEVANDHLRCRCLPQPMFGRLWRSLTGREAREQYLIDVNFANGVSAIAVWLQDLQSFQAESDMAIAAMASKLAETRDCLGEHFASIREALGVAIDDANGRIDRLTRRVNILDARARAENHIKLLLQHLEGERDYPPQPLLAKAFFVIDQLWWGDFGAYCRLAEGATEIRDCIEIASVEVGEYIARAFEVGARQLFPVEELLKSLSKMPEEERLILGYLAEVRASNSAPLFRALARAVTENAADVTSDRWLPRVFSPIGLSIRLFHESRRAGKK
jgi:hypothetical protein